MRTGTYYLNNSGSRWVCFENGVKAKHTFVTKSGKTVVRTASEYRAYGNHATVVISYKGKRLEVFLDAILED